MDNMILALNPNVRYYEKEYASEIDKKFFQIYARCFVLDIKVESMKLTNKELKKLDTQFLLSIVITIVITFLMILFK